MRPDFGQWLKRQIEDRLMTRQAFARAVEVDPATVYAWLKNERTPLGTNIVRIARALDVSRDEVEAAMGDQPQT